MRGLLADMWKLHHKERIMEIKARLEKPFTGQQRYDFITANSRLDIRETETALEAWGYTAEEIEQQEQERFAREFFNTSLGYVRRKVNMKDGSTKDFLTDILSLLQVGVPIITYNADKTQNTNVLVTEKFINECKQQLLIDFYGAINNEN